MNERLASAPEDYYLDEFTFHFNWRTSRKRRKLFYHLVQQAMEIKPITCADVADGDGVITISCSTQWN